MSIRNGLVLLIIGLYMVELGFHARPRASRGRVGRARGRNSSPFLLSYVHLGHEMAAPFFAQHLSLPVLALVGAGAWAGVGRGSRVRPVGAARRDPRYRAHLVSTSPSCSSQVGAFPNFDFAVGIGIQV